MAGWSRSGTLSSRSLLKNTAAWASLAKKRRRQGAVLATPALWRLPFGSSSLGFAGATTRCIGHGLGLLAGMSGCGFLEGAARPTDEIC
jgi:hypothetical protein